MAGVPTLHVLGVLTVAIVPPFVLLYLARGNRGDGDGDANSDADSGVDQAVETEGQPVGKYRRGRK